MPFGLGRSQPRKPPVATPVSERERKQGYLSHQNAPLLQLSPDYTLTLQQSFEGVQIFGGTGSGKTSGSGRYLARSLLHAGYGGIVFCAKPDEATTWIEHAEATGRSAEVLRFSEDTPLRFNFVQYELAKGASPFDVAEVIDNAREAANPAASLAGGSENSEFWNAAARDLLVSSMLVLYGATGGCELDELRRLIATAPLSREQAESTDWQNEARFFSLAMSAVGQRGKYVAMGDLQKALDYFRDQFAIMSEKMRSSVVQTLMTTLNRFSFGMLAKLFTTGTNIVPEMAHEGAIIIVDIPVLGVNREDARIAAQIWKYAFQRATTRQANERTRPVFLWADESQYFLSEKDVEFQSTARSSRVTTVYLTQSLPAYQHAIGGTEKAATATRAFLANLRTMIFHANKDEDTNRYASELIGKTLVWRKSLSRGENQSHGRSRSWSDAISESLSKGSSWSQSSGHSSNYGTSEGKSKHWDYSRSWWPTTATNEGKSSSSGSSYGSSEGGSKSKTDGFSRTLGESTTANQGITETQGVNQQKDYRLDPDVFVHELRSGGSRDNYQVDAVIVSPVLSEPYLKVRFDQRFA